MHQPRHRTGLHNAPEVRINPQQPHSRWIDRLAQRQQRHRQPDRYQQQLNGAAERRGPIDTIILGDSICKYIDEIRHTQVVAFPGITCIDLASMIRRNKIREMANKKVILVHCGTNDLDLDWEDTVYDICRLLVLITDQYPRAHVIWSSILPRPAPTERFNTDEVRNNIIAINNKIRERQRQLRIVTCPSHTSFHKAKYPVRRLFACDFLHLKPKGTFLLRELYRQHLIRLRDLWGIETWPVHMIPEMETRIEWNWRSKLCGDHMPNIRYE